MTTITAAMIDRFACALHAEDRAPATIVKYCRDLRAFAAWLGPQPLAQSQINDWKAHLLAQGYAPVTINARLAALNSFFRLLGWQELHARFLKIQRRVFRDPARVLTRREYERLLRTARRQGREEQVLLLETLCATGIRVSELSAITVQAVAQGRAVLTLKGKTRVILLPRALRQRLSAHIKRQHLSSGTVFRDKRGRALTRYQIWHIMKRLAAAVGVAASKAFPHNLRHLFATTYYSLSHDIVRLADVLGHSALETTRLYLASSGSEHLHTLERLPLLL